MIRLALVTAAAVVLAGPALAQTQPRTPAAKAAPGPTPKLVLAMAAKGPNDSGRAILKCGLTAQRKLTGCSVISATPADFATRALIAASTTPPVPLKAADGSNLISPLLVGFAAAPNAGAAVLPTITMRIPVPDAKSAGAALLSCGLTAERRVTGCKIEKESTAGFGQRAILQMATAPPVPKTMPGMGTVNPPIRLEVIGQVPQKAPLTRP